MSDLKNNTESVELFRRRLASTIMGQSFNGKRDMYESLGYPQVIMFDDYNAMYDRGDLATTIVNAYPDSTWFKPPVIRERHDICDTNTPFEKAWKEITTTLPIWSQLLRCDRLSGIGEFGVLFLGYNDGKDFKEPAVRATKLLYCKPLHQGNVTINRYDEDPHSERYGLPEMYRITFGESISLNSSESPRATIEKDVHWTRCLHVADNKKESDVFGEPRLKSVYNRVLDIHKILGCSAEMFWQGAFQGLAFQLDPEAQLANPDELEDEIQKYVHGMQPYMKLQGIDTKVLATKVADPASHSMTQLRIICGVSGIPLRVLTGSERGELSSTQDGVDWRAKISNRCNGYVTDDILRPLLVQLNTVGILPNPTDGINSVEILWHDNSAATKKQDMETARIIADCMRMYMESGAYHMIRPDYFLEKVLKFEAEDIMLFDTFDPASFADAMEAHRKSGEGAADGDRQYSDGNRLDHRPDAYDKVNQKGCVM